MKVSSSSLVLECTCQGQLALSTRPLHGLTLRGPAYSFTAWECHRATSQGFLCSWKFQKVKNAPRVSLLQCALPVVVHHPSFLLAVKAIDSLTTELLLWHAPLNMKALPRPLWCHVEVRVCRTDVTFATDSQWIMKPSTLWPVSLVFSISTLVTTQVYLLALQLSCSFVPCLAFFPALSNLFK